MVDRKDLEARSETASGAAACNYSHLCPRVDQALLVQHDEITADEPRARATMCLVATGCMPLKQKLSVITARDP